MTDINEEIKKSFENIDKKVGEALAKHDEEFKAFGKASAQSTSDLKALTAEHKSLADELKKMGDAIAHIDQNKQTMESSQTNKTLSSEFANSQTFADFKAGKTTKAHGTFQSNLILTGGDNSVTRHDQLTGVVAGAFRPLTVMPTVMTGSTSSNLIYYSRELLHTNNAAETAEGSKAPQSITTFERVQEAVRNVTHFQEVSKQALDDSEFLTSYLDRRLSHGVQKRLESQIINGTGTGVELRGWGATGSATVQSGAGTKDLFGLTNAMKTRVLTSDYMPDYFYMNPVDWANMETQRVSASDDRFLAGNGSAITYINNGITPLLWGLPVVTSNAVPAGTIYCKSTDADMFFNRSGTVVDMYEQNKDNVENDIVTIKASARGAHAIFTPAAIVRADVTTITA